MGHYLDEVAEATEALTDLVLTGGLSPAAVEDDATAWWVRDKAFLRNALSTDEPASWIASTVGTFLPEAAHELKSMAALLRARSITGSLGPLARAVVERIGVICWILDVEGADAFERGWRAVLYALFCYKEYRKTIDLLGAKGIKRKGIENEHRELRERARSWFSPEVDADHPEDSALWTRYGSGIPTMTEMAALAMPRDIEAKVRRGVYAAQCGMTHPNIFVTGEAVQPSAGGGIEFLHRAVDVDKEVRAAFVSFSQGVMIWARYFSIENEFDALNERVHAISDRFEDASKAP